MGVVIDKLDQMQWLMKLLAIFTPVLPESSLGVTAVKFTEPTMTEHDEYLGLGRLVRVHEETNSAVSAFRDDLSEYKPLLLPVSMFCLSLGCHVNSFQVVGNPKEFPAELRNLTAQHHNNLVLMPWRSGSYPESLFWGSLHRVAAPIALVVHRDEPVSDEPVSRSRSNTVDRAAAGAPVPIKSSHSLVALSIHDLKGVTKVAAVIIGVSSDAIIFAMLTRIAERKNIAITVYISGDKKLYEQSVRESYGAFKHNYATQRPLTKIETLRSASTDLVGIWSEINDLDADLVLTSFVEPVVSVGSNPQGEDTPSGSARDGRGRSNSISMALAATFGPAPEPDVVSFRRQIGVPETLVNSSLEHPELGFFGSRLKDSDSVRFVMVVHESLFTKLRRATIHTMVSSDAAGVVAASVADVVLTDAAHDPTSPSTEALPV